MKNENETIGKEVVWHKGTELPTRSGTYLVIPKTGTQHATVKMTSRDFFLEGQEFNLEIKKYVPKARWGSRYGGGRHSQDYTPLWWTELPSLPNALTKNKEEIEKTKKEIEKLQEKLNSLRKEMK